MRFPVVGALLASALLLVACDPKKATPEKAPATETRTTRAPLVEQARSSTKPMARDGRPAE